MPGCPDARTSVDVGDLTAEELRAELAAALSGAEGELIVAWPTEGVVATLAQERLLSGIDDLWYPAVDDLVMVRRDRALVLVLDHEERLTVITR